MDRKREREREMERTRLHILFSFRTDTGLRFLALPSRFYALPGYDLSRPAAAYSKPRLHEAFSETPESAPRVWNTNRLALQVD